MPLVAKLLTIWRRIEMNRIATGIAAMSETANISPYAVALLPRNCCNPSGIVIEDSL